MAPQTPSRGDGGGLTGRWRVAFVAMVFVILGEALVIFALADPLGLKAEEATVPTFQQATPTPTPSPTRPVWQFAPASNDPVPGAQQCPDAGSVGAGTADIKTEVLRITGKQNRPVRLLGPNRRVVIADGAVMTGSITICGDGGTVLVIGSLKGTVLMRGSGVKIVVQDGGREKLPPAYFTTNGSVFECTTVRSDTGMPHCDDYLPRPNAKPNG